MTVPTCEEFDQPRHVPQVNLQRVQQRGTLISPDSDLVVADNAGLKVTEVRVPSSSFDTTEFVWVRNSGRFNQFASQK